MAVSSVEEEVVIDSQEGVTNVARDAKTEGEINERITTDPDCQHLQ